jgi:hypothetical protein
MVAIRIRLIRPRRAVKDTAGLVGDLTNDVRTVAANGQRWIATYPPQTLTATGYVRTGTLKRSWSHTVQRRPNQIVGIVGSNPNIAPYNRPVQGSPQVKIFQTAGWRGVDGLRQQMQNDLDRRVRTTVRKFAR